MISWDEEAVVNVTDPAAAIVMKQLASGSSVSASVRAAYDGGLGVTQTIPAAHLGFLGNGDDTLNTALQAATSTPQPPAATSTARATRTAIPAVKHRKKKKAKLKSCRRYFHRVHGKCVKTTASSGTLSSV